MFSGTYLTKKIKFWFCVVEIIFDVCFRKYHLFWIGVTVISSSKLFKTDKSA